MFIVKATYNSETRRFTVQESSFPLFETIQSQLYRVFPIRGSYYLSRLMFCPSEGSRVVVGKEIHNEAQYIEHIAPFSGRLWPNGLLRFNVVDEIPHKPPFATSMARVPSESSFTTRLARPIPRHPPQAAGSSTSMEVDDEWSATAGSNRYSMFSQSTRQSCCSVTEGKEEMKELMSNFLRDFNSVMSSTFTDAPTVPAPVSPPSPETVVPEQKNTDHAIDVTIPGAFVHPVPSDVPTQAERPVHVGISCDDCGNCVRGARFKCQKCDDFDLCEECVTQRNAKYLHQIEHAEKEGLQLHSFLQISKPGDPVTVSFEVPEDLLDLHSPSSPQAVHTGVVCDFCDNTIVGTRHKCLDCLNFDLCDNCFPRHNEDHPGHEFISFKTPRRIRIYSLQGGDETPRFDHSRSRVNVRSAVHHANCDLCDSRIRGTRYKCLACPDFDTCASCYSIVPEQHPKHTFVKLEAPQDLSPRDPNVYRRHSARCNECGGTIRGVRYKCLHPECPDYDLCSKCEALPIEVHPDLHPLIKLRSPEVVIPTVYRVGGTTLIDSPARRPETAGVAVSTDPAPEKADVAVHAETKTDKTDVGVTTTPPATESVERSLLMPVLPTPPPFAPGTASETIQHLADVWRDEAPKINESIADAGKETTETHADFPSFPSLFSAFMAKQSELQKKALHATFVSDVNVEDGQVFPPGAEFVKCWHIRNDGETAWPESTGIIFIAGDRMPAFDGAPLNYHVGKVEKGASVDVTAYDMKAPEIPGKYVGYWRLSDGAEPFGQSVWCEISVPVPSGPTYTHESLASSEVVMPEPSHARAVSIDELDEEDVPRQCIPSTPVRATLTLVSPPPSTDVDSTGSLLDEFDTASDEDWEAYRQVGNGDRMVHSDTEYVVLYDEQSTDDEDH